MGRHAPISDPTKILSGLIKVRGRLQERITQLDKTTAAQERTRSGDPILRLGESTPVYKQRLSNDAVGGIFRPLDMISLDSDPYSQIQINGTSSH